MSQRHYVENLPAPVRIDDYAVIPDAKLVRLYGTESAEMVGRVLGDLSEFCRYPLAHSLVELAELACREF